MSTTEEFAETVFGAMLGAQTMQAMYLGDRLGWYRALAAEGPLTPVELARRTGTFARYAQEWLEYQAVSGILTEKDGAYHLPPGHAEVLVDTESLSYLSPLARLSAATGAHLPDLLHAYRTGGGVSWSQLGADAREAQAALNRPLFMHQLGQELLADLLADLTTDPTHTGRIADVGCGEGWSGIGLALAHPDLRVDGFDIDEPSIEAARRHAAAHDVQDRVTFTVADASDSLTGDYDAVFAFECVHDVPDPVAFLSTMRRLAKPGAPVVVMDERTAPAFDPGAGPIEQLLYGFSVLCCLPDGLSHAGSAATGTVMRPSTLAGYARSAGFTGVDELPIEHEMFRFSRLTH